MRKLNRRLVVIGLVVLVALIVVVLIATKGDLSLIGTAVKPAAALDSAYADLTTRLGQSVNAQNSIYKWDTVTFPDNSLGCPQPGITYTPGSINGYRINITFGGTVYSYRSVSADGQGLFVCPQGDAGGNLGFVPPTVSGPVNEPKALIDAVFQDLNQRQKSSFTRENSHYQFTYNTAYASSDLGCPQPGKNYTNTPTAGWQIVIKPDAGGSYDYRALDEKSFWFCTNTQ